MGTLGITVRTFVGDPGSKTVGLIAEIPDLDAWRAMMESEAGAEAMKYDGVKPETLVILLKAPDHPTAPGRSPSAGDRGTGGFSRSSARRARPRSPGRVPETTRRSPGRGRGSRARRAPARPRGGAARGDEAAGETHPGAGPVQAGCVLVHVADGRAGDDGAAAGEGARERAVAGVADDDVAAGHRAGVGDPVDEARVVGHRQRPRGQPAVPGGEHPDGGVGEPREGGPEQAMLGVLGGRGGDQHERRASSLRRFGQLDVLGGRLPHQRVRRRGRARARCADTRAGGRCRRGRDAG